MYKPCSIREMVTPAIHKKPAEILVNGRTQKTYAVFGNAKGKFKQKGTSEMNTDGLYVVNTKTTYMTWFKTTYEAKDIMTINGIDYEVIGSPENVENRGRYTILNLEVLDGGA